MPKKISIIIAEDHQIYIDALIGMFKGTHITCIGQALDGRELLDLLQQNLRPDIILLDINMPVLNGGEALDILKERYPSIKVIIISQYDHMTTIDNYFDRGARAYIPKSQHLDELIKAIDNVMEVEKYSDNLPDFFRIPHPSAKKTFLFTAREINVIRGIIDNKTTTEIANELCVSVKTIELDRKSIYDKANVNSVVELTKLTNTTGWYFVKNVK